MRNHWLRSNVRRQQEISLVSFAWPYRRRITTVLGLILASTGCSLVFPWGMKIIFDEVLPRKDIHGLEWITGLLILCIALRAGLNYVRKTIAQSTGERIVADIRERLFRHSQRISLTTLQLLTPAQVFSRLTDDTGNIRQFMSTDLVEGIYSAVSIVFLGGLLLVLNFQAACFLLATLPIFAFCYVKITPLIADGSRDEKELRTRLFSRLSDVLYGMSVVRVFSAQDHETDIFQERQDLLLACRERNHSYHCGLGVFIEVVVALASIAVLGAGALLSMTGKMTVGELMAFYTYTGMLFAPVIRLAAINPSFQDARTSLGRIREIISIDAPQQSEASLRTIDQSFRGNIEFVDVSFCYPEGSPAIHGLTFSLEPGCVLGIIGPSGAGKTTLVGLLLGLLKPQAGKILIDGLPLDSIDGRSYLDQVGVVLQDDFLFNASIEENIRYGCVSATFDEVRKAALASRADEFIRRLPGGYQFIVGDRGRKLSNGQRQRIALARALVRRPSLLILDEATSAVDALTENGIQQAVREFMKEKSMVVIAHRFSTISNADRIIVLDRGRMVQQGGHNYLLKNNGFYSTLYQEQFKERRTYCETERIE